MDLFQTIGMERWLARAAKKPQTGPPLWCTQFVKDAYKAGFSAGLQVERIQMYVNQPDYKGGDYDY